MRWTGPVRENELARPENVLVASYRSCVAIRLTSFATDVPLESYPAGYFGGNVEEGKLVTQRREFRDESDLKTVFMLLNELMGDQAEEWELEFFDDDSAEFSRKSLNLRAALVVEIVGPEPMRFELEPEAGKLLVDDCRGHWSVFYLDPPSSSAVQALMRTKAPL